MLFSILNFLKFFIHEKLTLYLVSIENKSITFCEFSIDFRLHLCSLAFLLTILCFNKQYLLGLSRIRFVAFWENRIAHSCKFNEFYECDLLSLFSVVGHSKNLMIWADSAIKIKDLVGPSCTWSPFIKKL